MGRALRVGAQHAAPQLVAKFRDMRGMIPQDLRLSAKVRAEVLGAQHAAPLQLRPYALLVAARSSNEPI